MPVSAHLSYSQCHTCQILWTGICRTRRRFREDLINFCEISFFFFFFVRFNLKVLDKEFITFTGPYLLHLYNIVIPPSHTATEVTVFANVRTNCWMCVGWKREMSLLRASVLLKNISDEEKQNLVSFRALSWADSVRSSLQFHITSTCNNSGV